MVKTSGPISSWEVRTWDALTVAAMVTSSVLCALWLVTLS
jgi:hypothetical protein